MHLLLWLLLTLVVLGFILLGGGNLALKWCLEPVGIAIPAFASFAVFFAPQMPDMFYGMAIGYWHGHPSEGFQHALGFPMAAAVLGLESWYWTRAALYGRIRLCDATWVEGSRAGSDGDSEGRLTGSRLSFVQPLGTGDEGAKLYTGKAAAGVPRPDWSDEWSPRIGLIISAAVTIAPIVLWLQDKMPTSQLAPIVAAIGFGLFLQLVIFILAVYRARIMREWMVRLLRSVRIGREAKLWRSRVLSTVVAAPFGWPSAVFLLLMSAVATLVVVERPETLDFVHAPTAAILALAFLIAPVTIILAALRDLTDVIVLLLESLVGLLSSAATKVIAERRTAVTREGMADVIGVGALLLLPSLYAWTGNWMDVYPVRAIEANPRDQRAAVDARHPFEYALQAWMARPKAAASRPGGPMPVVVVAVEGGASRSAAWFLPVMRMLDERTGGAFGQYVFAISGVSGGSLGAATYEELAARSGGPGVEWRDVNVRKGMVELARGDLLAPAIATFFLPDTLHRLLQPVWPFRGDRAAALEERFERNWTWTQGFAIDPSQAKKGFLDLQRSRPVGALPLLFLNGTDVQTGRRLITSSVEFKGQDDLFAVADDFLDDLGYDVPMSTAVTNSARFPFISPAGRFDEGDQRSVVDGGVFENYGARTAWELARKISAIGQDAVEPIIVIVSDDTDGLADPLKATQTVEKGMRRIDETALSCLPIAKADKQQIVEESKKVERASGAGYVPEGINSLQGLFSTRGAHGKGELFTIRRSFCPTSQGGPIRFIHIDLPRFLVEEQQSAPMNWVLNEQVCKFFFGPALTASFNLNQASLLREEFARLGIAMPDVSQVPKPDSHATDCALDTAFSSNK